MSTKKKALGKGLGQLIQDRSMAEAILNPKEVDQLLELPVESIRPNPYQPRLQFSEEALKELAKSIEEVGVLQPIIVKAVADGYELVSGERRLRAAKLAALETVPAIVRELDEKSQAQIAIIENVQREGLNPIEEGRAYRQMMETYGITQAELGEFIGKSRGYVGNTMRLLQLDPRVITYLEEGTLSVSQGKNLLSLPLEKQYAAARKIVEGKLTVRKASETVLQVKAPSQEELVMQEVADELMPLLGTKVKITPRGRTGAGTITLPYQNTEQLEHLVEVLRLGAGEEVEV